MLLILDFWPGEYAKTYVYAKKDYASVLEAFRAGNVFITTGDLIDSLFVSVSQGELCLGKILEERF